MKIVGNVSSGLNISFDHDVYEAGLDEWLTAEQIEAFEKGEMSESDVIDLLYRNDEIYPDVMAMADLEVVLRLEED